MEWLPTCWEPPPYQALPRLKTQLTAKHTASCCMLSVKWRGQVERLVNIGQTKKSGVITFQANNHILLLTFNTMEKITRLELYRIFSDRTKKIQKDACFLRGTTIQCKDNNENELWWLTKPFHTPLLTFLHAVSATGGLGEKSLLLFASIPIPSLLLWLLVCQLNSIQDGCHLGCVSLFPYKVIKAWFPLLARVSWNKVYLPLTTRAPLSGRRERRMGLLRWIK